MGEQVPSWKKYENHPGPDPLELHDALRRWNLKKGGQYASSGQSGGKLTFGTPRKGKCRDLKVGGVRIR